MWEQAKFPTQFQKCIGWTLLKISYANCFVEVTVEILGISWGNRWQSIPDINLTDSK